MKFKKEENQKHWDKYAKNHPDAVQGASFDADLVILENEFVQKLLKKIKPSNLLDVGCGNGQRTKLFSKYAKNILGIDYSKEMVKQAKKLENKKVQFEHADIWKFSPEKKFDAIVTCRCFINQPNYQQQIKLFKMLHTFLKKNGHLIIVEASVEGLTNLNRLRKDLELDPIKEHWFNLHIKEKIIIPKIKHLYKIKKIQRLGYFYFLARILHPFINPKQNEKKGKIIDFALKSQSIIKKNDEILEEYGRHLMIHFQKI